MFSTKADGGLSLNAVVIFLIAFLVFAVSVYFMWGYFSDAGKSTDALTKDKLDQSLCLTYGTAATQCYQCFEKTTNENDRKDCLERIKK